MFSQDFFEELFLRSLVLRYTLLSAFYRLPTPRKNKCGYKSFITLLEHFYPPEMSISNLLPAIECIHSLQLEADLNDAAACLLSGARRSHFDKLSFQSLSDCFSTYEKLQQLSKQVFKQVLFLLICSLLPYCQILSQSFF